MSKGAKADRGEVFQGFLVESSIRDDELSLESRRQSLVRAVQRWELTLFRELLRGHPPDHDLPFSPPLRAVVLRLQKGESEQTLQLEIRKREHDLALFERLAARGVVGDVAHRLILVPLSSRELAHRVVNAVHAVEQGERAKLRPGLVSLAVHVFERPLPLEHEQVQRVFSRDAPVTLGKQPGPLLAEGERERRKTKPAGFQPRLPARILLDAIPSQTHLDALVVEDGNERDR